MVCVLFTIDANLTYDDTAEEFV